MKKDKVSGECINCAFASKVLEKSNPANPDLVYCPIRHKNEVAHGKWYCVYSKKKS
jgi:hypothetical protein